MTPDHGTQLTIDSAQRRGVDCWVIEIWANGRLTGARAFHFEFLADEISDQWRRQYREYQRGESIFVRKRKISPIQQIEETF